MDRLSLLSSFVCAALMLGVAPQRSLADSVHFMGYVDSSYHWDQYRYFQTADGLSTTLFGGNINNSSWSTDLTVPDGVTDGDTLNLECRFDVSLSSQLTRPWIWSEEEDLYRQNFKGLAKTTVSSFGYEASFAGGVGSITFPYTINYWATISDNEIRFSLGGVSDHVHCVPEGVEGYDPTLPVLFAIEASAWVRFVSVAVVPEPGIPAFGALVALGLAYRRFRRS